MLLVQCLFSINYTWVIPFIIPRHNNDRGIKCYPCPYIRKSHQQRPISMSNSFDQNFMKLGTLFSTMSTSSFIMIHIVPYPQELLPFVHEKFTIFYCVRSLSPVILITSLLILVTMFNTIMSFSSLKMVYNTICRHQVLPFVDEK